MKLSPPPRRPRTAPLFAAVESVVIDAPAAKPKRVEPVRESFNVWPYLVLHIHPDGTAGAEAPKACAYWDRVNRDATECLERLRREVTFLERWTKAAKRESVELKI